MTIIVDFRSDTLTKPTAAMKHAMVNTALGDDVFGEDPTVKALESKLANILGKQAALFVPSGTMANLIAIMVHCKKRGSEAIVGHLSHIYKYEQGGAAHVAGVQLTTVQNKEDGTFDVQELVKRIGGADIHEAVTSMVAIENTHNICGGKALPLEWIDEVADVCKSKRVALHMDGARLFNSCTYLRAAPDRVVRECDSVSVCFSKGLSAPVGSALVGSCHFIQQARRMRKMLGGGMRQAGVLAAAAIVALDEVVPLLVLDHDRAKILGTSIDIEEFDVFTTEAEKQHTNIVLLVISEYSKLEAQTLVNRLAQIGADEIKDGCSSSDEEGVIVKCICVNEKIVRLTTHRELDDEQLCLAIMKITYVLKELEAAYPYVLPDGILPSTPRPPLPPGLSHLASALKPRE